MKANLSLSGENVIGRIDERIYGSFIEHMGRAVYTGIYQPTHPSADESGFRNDVRNLVKELSIPIIRYPGGNFVSGYKWEDGIGDKSKRPRRLDLAWKSIETNEIGIHEFYDWTKSIGAEINMAVNLGTRGIEDARNLVEYCNFPEGTYWSNLRKKNGAVEPFSIKTWCLGNEMDGEWQIGHKTSEEYGRLAAETAKAMKQVDSNIELVLCGSSNSSMPTFGEWELTALNEAYDYIDYVSLHQYYGNYQDNIQEYLAVPLDMDNFIKGVIAICDTVKAKKHSDKQINLSFDEWNIWYHSNEHDKTISDWQVAPPLLEDHYNLEDALVLGGLLITLLKNSDRVKIACLAQLVNVIAPIMTNPEGGCWRQTIFYPFFLASKYGRGEAIGVKVDCDSYSTLKFKAVPYVDAVAVKNENNINVFVLNRSFEKVKLDLEFSNMGLYKLNKFYEISGEDLKAVNDEFNERIVPKENILENISIDDHSCTVEISPLSWNVLSFELN